MPRSLPDGYFEQGPFLGSRRGELFRTYTCLVCGHRSATWEGFRLHRKGCPVELLKLEELLMVQYAG